MGLSRNKVAVPEGAAGSPPFYGEFQSNVFWTVCAARMPTVGVVSVVAGVEEIVGLPFPWGDGGSGAGVLLGSRTATPQGFLWCGSDAHAE